MNQTFSSALNHWLTLRCLNKKPRTQEFYRYAAGIITANWKQPDLPADSVTPELILAFAQDVAHVCPSVWNQIVSALCFVSPCGKCLKRKRGKVREFTPPDQATFAKFLADVDSNPRTQAGLIVRFLCLTGLRKKEAFALRWENVLADRILVPAECCKSGKARMVPLLPGIAVLLAQLRAVDSGGFVLPRGNPRKAIEAASLRVFGVQWSLHCFRHLFATRCVAQSIDVPTVAKWLGHQDGGATLTRHYLHLLDDHSQRMAERVRMLPAVSLAELVRNATVHVAIRV